MSPTRRYISGLGRARPPVFGEPVAVDSYVVGLPVVGGYVVGLRPEGRSESAEESQITVPRQATNLNGTSCVAPL
jgi:hypothetical protein